VDNPIFCLDETKGYITISDIICELLPSLALEDGSTAGYAALSSLNDDCIVINIMKINGPLQQLLNMPFGKYIIQHVGLQNGKAKMSEIGKMILLEELSSSSTLSKVNLNHYNYQKLLEINDLKDLIIDYEKEKYQKIIVEPDTNCNAQGCWLIL